MRMLVKDLNRDVELLWRQMSHLLRPLVLIVQVIVLFFTFLLLVNI